MGVLGSEARRGAPTDIIVVPRSFDAGRPSGVKKTSTILVNRPLGTDVLVGFLVKRRQRVISLKFTTDAGPRPSATDVTKRPEWKGALGALHRFSRPGRLRKWLLFQIPSVTDFSFTSELTVSSPPPPPEQQDVPFVALHAKKGEEASRVFARIRMGAFGYGVSVVRAPSSEWKAT